jgi:hypothetical protein
MSRRSSRSASQDDPSYGYNTDSGRNGRSDSQGSSQRQPRRVVINEPSAVPVNDEENPITYDKASNILEENDSSRIDTVIEAIAITPNAATARRAESIRQDEYGNILVDDNDTNTPINSPSGVPTRDRKSTRGSFYDMIGGKSMLGGTFRGNPEDTHNSTFYRTKSFGMMLVSILLIFLMPMG